MLFLFQLQEMRGSIRVLFLFQLQELRGNIRVLFLFQLQELRGNIRVLFLYQLQELKGNIRVLFLFQLQEMRGNIRVFCRARKDDRAESCLKFLNDQDLMVVHPQNGKKMFSFDKAFDIDTTQEQVRDCLSCLSITMSFKL